MKRLKFLNPVFKKGLNFTVRLGTKWAGQLSIGEFIEIEGWNGVGRVEKMYVCRLADIPKEVLEDEHDPACHEWKGLLDAIKAAYPELRELSGDAFYQQVVTCVGFYLYEFYV